MALARALVNRPALLLLDEPLGALDLKLRRQMQLELKRIQTEVGLTFVHVTHDQEEAMTMADTVAVMNHGRIEQLGSPADLYELPRTAFVANFLGQSNLVRRHGHRAARRSAACSGSTCAGRASWCPAARAVRTDGAVLVGARPEKMRLLVGDQAPGRGENVLGPGTVTDVSFMGVSTQYQVEIPGLGTFGVFAQNLLGGCDGRGRDVRCGWPGRSTSRSGWTARRPATTARSTWTTSCEHHGRARRQRRGESPPSPRAAALDGRTCSCSDPA